MFSYYGTSYYLTFKGWNYLDIFGILLFFAALALRLISLVTNEAFFVASR